jgi:hypothetical protein
MPNLPVKFETSRKKSCKKSVKIIKITKLIYIYIFHHFYIGNDCFKTIDPILAMWGWGPRLMKHMLLVRNPISPSCVDMSKKKKKKSYVRMVLFLVQK